MRVVVIGERILLTVGLLCAGWSVVTYLDAKRFQQSQPQMFAVPQPVVSTGQPVAGEEHRSTLSGPLGRLQIPRLGLSAVVLPGEDDTTLRRAVGYLRDTPLPWQAGNTGLAAHRDTFFRPLERVRAGDEIVLDTPRGRFRYRVRRFMVVQPDDVWVLDPSARPMLTLITCYPFRYVGPAPKRFVVQADRI